MILLTKKKVNDVAIHPQPESSRLPQSFSGVAENNCDGIQMVVLEHIRLSRTRCTFMKKKMKVIEEERVIYVYLGVGSYICHVQDV